MPAKGFELPAFHYKSFSSAKHKPETHPATTLLTCVTLSTGITAVMYLVHFQEPSEEAGTRLGPDPWL